MDRIQRHKRIRKKIQGTAARPRLSVHRSIKGIWAQIINDSSSETLVFAHHKELKEKQDNKKKQAKHVGLILAKKARAQNILRVVFDRGGNKYHGRIQALAEGAREGGLQF